MKRIFTLALFGLAFSNVFCLTASAQTSDIAVVVNSRNSVSNVSIDDLRKFFAGEKRTWPGGMAVKLLVRGPGTPERIALLELLQMTEEQYKQYWTTQVYRGDALAQPLQLPSVGMTKEALSVYPGGIALVERHDIKPGMKVLKIAGLSPGDAGYRLR